MSPATTDKKRRTQAPDLMLVPSLSCPSRCTYCFGPRDGRVASRQTLDAAVDLLARVVDETGGDKYRVTLHGGEPLTAGPQKIGHILETLKAHFGRRCEVSIQSNLWLLSEALCDVLSEHRVSLGTSLDGPEAITDDQRGTGYFGRTMAGIDLARSRGLPVSCIATCTTLEGWSEVLEFFKSERLDFAVHPAVPVLGDPIDTTPTLSPAAYGELLGALLEAYVVARRDVRIATLDQLARGVLSGRGQVCTHQDCLGRFLVVDPEGDIYSCQRFIGHHGFRLGRLSDSPDLRALLGSPAARRLARWQDDVSSLCDQCVHWSYCRGGCPYNAWAAAPDAPERDPYCSAYRHVFDEIQQRLGREAGLPSNVEAVARIPFDGDGHPLFKRGPLIELARGGPHPTIVARNAKRAVAAVELARGPNLEAVAGRLLGMCVCRTHESAIASLRGMQREMVPLAGYRKNLYLQVTERCQLSCPHCYAEADTLGGGRPDMDLEALGLLVHEAREQGFRQAVITGGEPLSRPDRVALLELVLRLRSSVEPLSLVLCTNLALPLSDDDLLAIGEAFHEIVVSVDGDRQTHDRRRGEGSYDATVANLRRRKTIFERAPITQELSLRPVMEPRLRDGAPGRSVRALGRELGADRTRFHEVKPIGRAREVATPPAFGDPMARLAHGFQPRRGCGLGQSLYVLSNGEVYPCHALCYPRHLLGDAIVDGLAAVMDSDAFTALCARNVDTTRECRSCDLRYLCGGPCRAWDQEPAVHGLDRLGHDCAPWRRRARELLEAAYEYLDIEQGIHWTGEEPK